MNDVADVSVAGTGEQGGSPPPPAANLCPRCRADLERCGRAARFCPRCGASVQAPGVNDAPVTEASNADLTNVGTNSGTNGGATAGPAFSAAPPLPTPSTSAVTAHASAWLRLRGAQSGQSVQPFPPDSPPAGRRGAGTATR